MRERNSPISEEPQRLPKKQWPPLQTTLTASSRSLTGVLVLLSSLNLISPDDPLRLAKAIMIALSAMLVSFGVNHFAIHRGAELAATGYISAGITAVFSMLIVGGGLFASTYSALTIREVDELHLHEHGQALLAFIGARNKQAGEAGQIVPVLSANEGEMKKLAECEVAESCLSGRANGGRGSVSRAAEELARRASEIAAQVTSGTKTLEDARTKTTRLLGDYQKTLAQTDRPIEQRRGELVIIDAGIDQELSRMDEALPLSLLRAYAKELGQEVKIEGRPEASARLNDVLAKHAASLGAALDTIESRHEGRPAFPGRAGIGATFPYLGHFLPIAALSACIELIFPMTLWIYTLLSIRWRKHVAEHQSAATTEASRQERRGRLFRRRFPRKPRREFKPRRGHRPRFTNGSTPSFRPWEKK